MGKEGFDIGSSIDDDPYENEHVQIAHSLPFYVMEVITTGASTTVFKTSVAPLERIKILLQVNFFFLKIYGFCMLFHGLHVSVRSYSCLCQGLPIYFD